MPKFARKWNLQIISEKEVYTLPQEVSFTFNVIKQASQKNGNFGAIDFYNCTRETFIKLRSSLKLIVRLSAGYENADYGVVMNGLITSFFFYKTGTENVIRFQISEGYTQKTIKVAFNEGTPLSQVIHSIAFNLTGITTNLRYSNSIKTTTLKKPFSFFGNKNRALKALGKLYNFHYGFSNGSAYFYKYGDPAMKAKVFEISEKDGIIGYPTFIGDRQLNTTILLAPQLDFLDNIKINSKKQVFANINSKTKSFNQERKMIQEAEKLGNGTILKLIHKGGNKTGDWQTEIESTVGVFKI